MGRRIITTENLEEDVKIENHLRPQMLDDYIGQEKAKETLKIYIEAAKERHEALDHVLFYGPPGLGKTTLAGIIANEMGVNIKITSGPAIEKPGEMAAILNNLQEGDVLFVDEIHRLNRQVEEVLYPAMEDYAIDIMIGKGATARSIRLDLPQFTLVGATTRAGMLTAPLRDRFGVVNRLEFYTVEELKTIIERSAGVLEVEIDREGAYALAKRSRGTPRLANRLLKRVRDFAQVKYDGYISRQKKQVEQFKKLESKKIPEDIDYDKVKSLRIEAVQKLKEYRPVSIGQASRISGVSPADISVLLVYLTM